PRDCIAANGGIAAFVTEVAQVLVYPDQRQPFSGRLALVFLKQRFKPLSPGTNPGLRLPRSFVMELGRVRADDLPRDLARDPQLSADLLYRLAQREIGAAYLGNRLHNQHSNPGLPESRKASVDPTPRGPDWMKISPVAGSLFHEKRHARSSTTTTRNIACFSRSSRTG